ncbi:ABC1 family protein MCP2 [Exophiala dermatitidis]
MRLDPSAFRRGGATTTWTCARCKNSQTQTYLHTSRRDFSSQRRPIKVVRPRPRKAVIWAAAGGGLGASLLFFGDDIRHGWLAAERTGRVVTTLAVCINDYRVTLKQQLDDPEQESAILKACHKRCAERTLKVLEKNGSIFIKLGQHLSSMGYLLPTEWTETFVPLQDKCPVSSFESVEEMFLRDTGHRIEDEFDEFSKEPIGAASLAQVHIARLKNSDQKVAVKVQHPSLEEWVPLDLALTRFTFRTLKRAFPEYDMEWLSNEMDFSLPQELDFSLEGANAMQAKEFFNQNTNLPVIIPNVISAHRRILVMDYVTGARVDNWAYFDQHNISRDEVSAALARIFNAMIFQDNAPLHCDPHGGNLAIRHNPKRRYPYNFDVILYDHGLYRVPDKKLRQDYAKLWLAVINADEAQMRKYAYELAGINDEQFPLFASAITGRDYRVLTSKKVATSMRDAHEKEAINEVFGEDLLQQLVQLLGHVPRIILLILKTNDLTRSLDESLGSKQPMRPMLILARYASLAVWQEEKEKILQQGGLLYPRNVWALFRAWLSHMKVELKLFGYERYLSIRRHLGLDS